MKNKRTLVLIAGAVLIIAAAVWGKQYYDRRYVGTDYYTMIPADYDVTPEAIYDMSGKDQVGTGVNYILTAYDEQGNAKTVKFTMMDGEIFQPGTYLRVTASSEIVLSQYVIEESSIPDGALEKIMTGNA